MTKHASGRHQKSTVKRVTCKSDGLNSKQINEALKLASKRLDEKQGMPKRVRMRIVYGGITE